MILIFKVLTFFYSRKSDCTKEGTFISINVHSSGESVVCLPAQEMKPLKNLKECQKFQPKAYTRPPPNDYVTLDGGDSSSQHNSSNSSQDSGEEERRSERGQFFPQSKFGMAQKKSSFYANVNKSHSSFAVPPNK